MGTKKPGKKAAALKVEVKKVSPKVFVTKTGEVCELDFTQGMTVGRAIELAGYRTDRVTDIRVNAKRVTDMATRLKAGDQISLLGKIAGA